MKKLKIMSDIVNNENRRCHLFYSDKPISSSKDDLLKRNGFAKNLAQSLINLNNSDTFSVGLFGKWGSGKTSLVNMTLQEIENQMIGTDEKKTVIVHFEPWNFSDSNQLLTQFFIRLSNEFRSKGDKNLARIGEALEKYSDAFEIVKEVPVVGGLLSLFGKKGASALGAKMKKGSNDKDIFKHKEYVVGLLAKQTNKILVVIDDIDRLSNEQIRQVFQLITSVAKFPNTTYLLVFDKEIVVNALEKVQEGSGEDYLEKIIQIPIQIPDIQKAELRLALLNSLDKIISEHDDIVFSLVHWQSLFESCIEPFIKNLRDVNRLCNAVQFKLSAIASEVDFTDMTAISALEIYFPSVYEWVKANKPVLTGAFDLSFIGAKNKSQKELYEFYQTQISALLQDKEANRDHIACVDTILGYLSHLFPHFGHKIGKAYEVYDFNHLRRNNQIAHPERFDRYFHLNLNYIGLKRSDVINAVQMLDYSEFEALLLELDQKGVSYEFLEDVNSMISDISSDRAKVIMFALFEISSQLDTIESNHYLSMKASTYAQYMILDLLDKLPPAERMGYISELLKTATTNSLPMSTS